MAVRSTSVTSGMDVSTPVVHDDIPSQNDQPEPPAVPAAAGGWDGQGRTSKALRTVAFHLVALACFTVPAIVLWWHVWSGHPSSTLTCGCGDPAQEVWFMAWPAWAIAHLHSVFFSGVVNVPHGANLLSNTSGPLVGVVLAPVTWLFGPVTATNVALTMAPALSAWACFAAIRPLVNWKTGAIPAALVFGYSAALVTSLTFGHVSVTVLVIPPFLFTTLHEIVIRQEHSVSRDGLLLAALLVLQFFISPEILVMSLVLAATGLVAVTVVGWRQLRPRSGHALPALGLGVGVTVAVLAYPTWFGLAGPQAVTGVLFALAPIAGVPLSGLLVPGGYGASANEYIRFGGYLGHTGPPADYVGWGVALAGVGSVIAARRRPLTWLLLLLAAATFWLALGAYLISGPAWLGHPWLPWRSLSTWPVLKEILPDQFVPLVTLFLAFLLAVGLDALHGEHWRRSSWLTRHRSVLAGAATLAVAAVALTPVLITFDAPLRVVPVRTPPYLRDATTRPPAGNVVLTIPFAVSGSTQPMLWQAMQGMRFRLAGAALKTPDRQGGPVGTGAPGSARRILTDLSIGGSVLPAGTPRQLATVRIALQSWQVDQVVITGASRDPVYASGFFTAALGVAPVFEQQAWVWKVRPGQALAPPVTGVTLASCRTYAASTAVHRAPLTMAHCVLFAGGRAA
jgi:hypothetical protein